MTDYFQTLDAVGTGVATTVTTPATTKTTSGTSVPKLVKQPNRTLTRTPSAAVPVLSKMPIKTFPTVVGTGVATKLYTALKTISTSGTLIGRLFFWRQGAGGFSIPMAERNWDAPVDERKWSADAYARFTYTVFGD